MDFLTDELLKKYSGKDSVTNDDLDVINAIQKHYKNDEVFVFFRLRKICIESDKMIGSVFGKISGNKDLVKDLLKGIILQDKALRQVIEKALFEILAEEVKQK